MLIFVCEIKIILLFWATLFIKTESLIIPIELLKFIAELFLNVLLFNTKSKIKKFEVIIDKRKYYYNTFYSIFNNFNIKLSD